MQKELTNFYQLLYQVTPVVILLVKSWSDSTFHCFVYWELVATLLKDNPAFYLLILQRFLNFPLIVRISSGEQIRGIGGNFKILKIFRFSLLKS